MDILGLVDFNLPQTSGLFTMFQIILGFLLAGIIIAVVVYLIVDYLSYKYKIIFFENVAGQGYSQTGRDIAKLIKLGNGGERVLYLKKRKTYLSAYGQKMGKNTYWFVIGQDGYAYNSTLGDFDAKRGELDIEPIDRDMRYMHVALRRNIEDRYKKQNFMDKYGTYIMNLIYIFIIFGGTWFILDKIGEIASQLSGTLTATIPTIQDLTEKLGQIAGSMNNICTGGQGYIPV